ncbi:hypothetical protein [Microbulbifer pacificus]|uniref:hypothetical protein n=1 Tax=Microbulbifer pacificus TaxID=407164 RepID=UPI000CF37349|nr:hypothetical protein [Microbulbifer pacificus]
MKLLRIALPLLAAFVSAPSLAYSNSGFGIGVAYDLGAGVTAQFRDTSFFANSDALAADFRLQNLRNDRGTLHAYIDGGLFYEDGGHDSYNDRAGVRLPIGLTFRVAPSLQAYIQAVPNYAFSDNEGKEGFEVDGALGIRLRF